MNEVSEKYLTRAEILALPGVSELLEGQEAAEGEYDNVLSVISSAAETVDSRAMVEMCVLQGGMNTREEAAFRRENSPWMTSIMSMENTDRPDEVVKGIASFAVSEMRKYLAMNRSTFLALSIEEREYARRLRGVTTYLLESIFWDQLYCPSDDGLHMRALDNLRKDVTEEERRNGGQNPGQSNIKGVLLRILNNSNEQLDIITQMTRLNPAYMVSLLENKAVPKWISEALQKFLVEWNNRRELSEMVIGIYSKGINAMLSVGADTNFILALNRLPSGEQLEDVANAVVSRAGESFDVLIPHYCGVSLEKLSEQGLSRYDIIQLGYRYAAIQEEAELLDQDEYSHPIDTITEVEERVSNVISTIEQILPLTRFAREETFVNMGVNIYAESRPVNIWYYRITEEGGKEMANFTRQDPLKPEAELAGIYVHEVAGHGMQILLAKRLLALGKITYTESVFASSQSEFFAQVLEEGYRAICKEMDTSDIPVIEPYKGDVAFPANSLPRIFLVPRQLPFGLSTVGISRLIEQALAQGEVKMSVEQVDAIIQEGGRIINEEYRRMFSCLGMVHPERSTLTELSITRDGLCYLGIQQTSIIDSEAEVIVEKVEDGDNVDWKIEALKVLKERFGDEWIRDTDAQAVFYSLLIFAFTNRNMPDWIEYLKNCYINEAKQALLEVSLLD